MDDPVIFPREEQRLIRGEFEIFQFLTTNCRIYVKQVLELWSCRLPSPLRDAREHLDFRQRRLCW
jgi:hypothetical protein